MDKETLIEYMKTIPMKEWKKVAQSFIRPNSELHKELGVYVDKLIDEGFSYNEIRETYLNDDGGD